MAVGDICKLTLQYHVHQRRCLGVFYARVVTSPGAGLELSRLMIAVQEDLLPALVGALSVETYLDCLVAFKETGAHEPKWEAYLADANGEVAGEAMPANTPLRYTRTANTASGPKKSGFNLSGVSLASTTGSQGSAAAVAGIFETLRSALLNPWTTSGAPVGSYQPVVKWNEWDRVTDPENPEIISTTYDDVDTVSLNPIFQTLRRRQTQHTGVLAII